MVMWIFDSRKLWSYFLIIIMRIKSNYFKKEYDLNKAELIG